VLPPARFKKKLKVVDVGLLTRAFFCISTSARRWNVV